MSQSELVKSAYKYLMKASFYLDSYGKPVSNLDGNGNPQPLPQIRNLIAAGDLGKDSTWVDGFVFRTGRDGVPFRDLEGTGTGAICLYSYDQWATPSALHSSKFPNLHIAIFADVTRASGRPVTNDAADRAYRIYDVLHPLFHDSANRISKFDTLPIISTVAGGGFSIDDVPTGDGLMRGDQIYNIHLL